MLNNRILDKKAKDLTEAERKELDTHIKQAIVRGSNKAVKWERRFIAFVLIVLLFPILMILISLLLNS